MRIVRFRIDDKTRYSGTPFRAFRRGRLGYAARQVVLLAPVLPSKIVLRGPSYREHGAELSARPSLPL